MRFTKMHGLGNDFVVLDEPVADPDQVRWICDRRRGIGADGVLVVGPRPSMDYWNADGTRAEMCGNGLRCVARYAVSRGWAGGGEWFTVDTPVGPRRALVEDGSVTVEVGPVDLGEEVEIDGRRYRLVRVGNPHAVTTVDHLPTGDVEEIGRHLNTHPAFPEGVNVEFVTVQDGGIAMRVWERGVGETLACGSGMVAAVTATTGRSHHPVTVDVPGGRGEVYFEGASAYLRGPAVMVYEGVLHLP